MKTNRLSFFLVFLLCFSIFVPPFQIRGVDATGENWLAGWNYRKSHSITNATGASTNYLVSLTAHYGTGADSGKDMYLNNHGRTDFGDVRFTSSDGSTQLCYWMESKIDSDNAVFWTKISDDLSSSNTTIHLYYGKSDETTTSSYNGMFVLFDHFDGVSLNTSKWASYGLHGGSVSVSNSWLNLSDNTAQFHWGAGVTSVDTLPTKDYAIEASLCRNYIYMNGGLGLGVGTTSKASQDTTYYGEYYPFASGSLSQSTPYYLEARYDQREIYGGSVSPCSQWVEVSAYVKDSSKTAEAVFTYNGSTYTVGPTAAGVEFSPLYVQIYYGEYSSGQVTAPSYCDWIGVRNYVDPEPVHSAWGFEETPAAGNPPTYTEVSHSTTVAGSSCDFGIKWADDNGLSAWIFGTNNTGSWVNETATEFSTIPETVNVTKTLTTANNSTNVVQWEFWANDTGGQWNNTGVRSLTTVARPRAESPTYLTCLPAISYVAENNWAWFPNGLSPYLNDYEMSNYVYSHSHIGEHMPHAIRYWDFADLESTVQPDDIINVTLRVYYYWNDLGVLRQSALDVQVWNGSNYLSVISFACLGTVSQWWQNRTSSDIWMSVFDRNVSRLNDARLQLYWSGDANSGIISVSYAELQVYWNSDPANSDISVSRTVEGLPATFSCKWTGLTANLSGYIFGTNNSGVWVNDQWKSFTSGLASDWANVTKTLYYQTNATILYEWWCNDTEGKWASTQVLSFKTQERKSLLSVPYYTGAKSYYCSEAALEMVFDYYGPDISQAEIGNAARVTPEGTYTSESRRACHFSNLSNSMGNDNPGNFTGYSNRPTGYGGFQHWFSEATCIEDIKNLVDQGYPIIVHMWYDSSHTSGHSRVVVGYDDSSMIVNDPGVGANVRFSYADFKNLWAYSNREGLFTSPWSVTITTPTTPVACSTFEISANVTYCCPHPFFHAFAEYPAYFSNATIHLPTGFSLAPGENATKLLSRDYITSGESKVVSWHVVAPLSPGSYMLSVDASGIVNGSVLAHSGYPWYSYSDRIGGQNSSDIRVEQGYFLGVRTDPVGIAVLSGEGWYSNNTLIPLVAPMYVDVSTDTRYRFDYWDVDGTPQGFGMNDIAVLMDRNHTAVAHYLQQFEVVFDQTGLSDDATGTVVTVNSTAVSVSNVPFTCWVESGDTLNYYYSLSVASILPDKQFRLNDVDGAASPITITNLTIINANYTAQYLITFGQAGVENDFTGIIVTTDTTGYDLSVLPVSFWWDRGSNHSFSFSAVLTVNATKQYGWVSTSGLTNLQSGMLEILDSGDIIGNYVSMSLLHHDVVLTNVTVSRSIVGQGNSVQINMTISNLGDDLETSDITVYANQTIVASIEGTPLQNGSYMIISCVWNVSGFDSGNYTIEACAEPVPGETDIADNNYTCGVPVHVGVPGDVSSSTPGVYDKKVDMKDIAYLVILFNTKPASPNWNPNADVDNNAVVSMIDIAIAILHFNQHE